MLSAAPAVLKVGGSVLEPHPSPGLLAEVARRVAAGEPMVLVHGGGKALSRRLEQMGVGTEFRRGLRVTDEATLEVAVMALAGEVNTRLVARLNRAGVRAVGLTGVDGGCVTARASDPQLGRVGTPAGCDGRLLRSLLAAGYTPVLAPIAGDGAGGVLNVNADLFAAAVAGVVGAERLTFLTDVAGVLDARGEVMPRLRLAELEAMEAVGAARGGMLPKLDACRAALGAGVARVEITGAAFGAGTRVVVETVETVEEAGDGR